MAGVDEASTTAGLQKGDVITEFAGEHVRSAAQLRRLIRETPPGRTLSLQVIRDGQARTLSAKLQAHTNNFHFQVPDVNIPQIEINPGCRAPIVARIGARTFSFFLMVLADRPPRPSFSQSSAARRTV